MNGVPFVLDCPAKCDICEIKDYSSRILRSDHSGILLTLLAKDLIDMNKAVIIKQASLKY